MTDPARKRRSLSRRAALLLPLAATGCSILDFNFFGVDKDPIPGKRLAVMRVNRGLIDAVNAIDPALTVATVQDYTRVAARSLVATIKIIPFGIPEKTVQEATGFRGAAIRSVILALAMTARVPYKTTTVATVREASSWLVPFISPVVQPSQIEEAITTFRRELARSHPIGASRV